MRKPRKSKARATKKIRRITRTKKISHPKRTSQKSKPVDLELLRDIMELMEKGNLNHFEYIQGNLRINLERGSPAISGYLPAPKPESSAPIIQAAQVTLPTPIIQAQAPVVQAAAPAPVAVPAEVPAAKPVDTSKDFVIVSPVVGSFYSAASPGADPFVKKGSHINEDTVVCIVEAMKLMNEIKAQVAGTITEVLVENGDPVEFGHELFRVRLD